MLRLNKLQFVVSLLAFAISVCASGPTAAAVRIEGLVQGGGGPLANSTVTLWAASAGQPRQLVKQEPTAMVNLNSMRRDDAKADRSAIVMKVKGVFVDLELFEKSVERPGQIIKCVLQLCLLRLLSVPALQLESVGTSNEVRAAARSRPLTAGGCCAERICPCLANGKRLLG
jgi:hypothetical protein